ncbi:hypothetical protein ASG52_00080 [Methylobacterium sp. Leaf456]|uniref:lysozyme inhibitor LprI family protein n=1 Tax=Methylobacterium sp. Leaf456 TaxID=1736382 RepID=UPI0007022649|nr:lysozyme inhibitor LprI family protein [Methylobacterium sp. Leaf456]KQT61329.1 hypothetical protein ASG52_00080 [Methylobacterium sp. Leaf456]
MVRACVAVAAFGLALGSAAAAECKGTTQADLNACADADLKRTDTAMNAAYGRLMKRIGPAAQQGLKEAQRAWLPYRDKTCDLEALGAAGGSAQPMVRAGCLAAITEERTKRLSGYLACQEGDLACVGNLAE